MKHLADLKQLSAREIQEILVKARDIKAYPGNFRHALAYKSLAMIFQKTSTRTRVSFEVAMTELGGHAIYIDWETSNFVLSGIDYETEYLSRNVNCIMARLLHNSDLHKIMESSQVPVINGCCEKFHPCQALTDVMTMQEHFEGDIADARLMYVGVQNNVSNSLALICDKLGISLTLATPPPDDNGECRDGEVDTVIQTSSHIKHTTDPASKVKKTDFIYTDTWTDMQYFNDPSLELEKNAKLKKMMPYQINREMVKEFDVKIMHDMPIHQGYEISAEMVSDPRAIIFQQAENRLHAQKGLLWWLFNENGLLEEMGSG